MPVRVIDVFESVEVDEDHGATERIGGQSCSELHQPRAIEQAGHRVMHRAEAQVIALNLVA